jgi:hypothetical protein
VLPATAVVPPRVIGAAAAPARVTRAVLYRWVLEAMTEQAAVVGKAGALTMSGALPRAEVPCNVSFGPHHLVAQRQQLAQLSGLVAANGHQTSHQTGET